ncbi:MAG TPA: polysaccharide deacetylase family protein, partial [Cytophaga sp.]|nr:polysaccharide deacetylase family protein [Cytophaga sp.]
MLKYNTLKYFFWAICLGMMLYSLFIESIPLYFFIALVVVWLGCIIIGAFRMRAEIFMPAICRLPQVSKNNIFLTFDDGPHPQYTLQILDILKQYHATAIFFCIGKNITLYPELVKRIVAEGHIIANHSYNHSNMIGIYPTQKVITEIEQTEEAIIACTGSSLKLYRPPFGVTNPNIGRAVQALNMKVVGWSVRSFDTVSKNKIEV